MPERLSRGTAPPHRRPLTLQRPAGAAQGFTLIEVMVVLVIFDKDEHQEDTSVVKMSAPNPADSEERDIWKDQ